MSTPTLGRLRRRSARQLLVAALLVVTVGSAHAGEPPPLVDPSDSPARSILALDDAAASPDITLLRDYLPRERLRWDPAWPKFSTGEWVVTGIAGATAITTAILMPRTNGWRGGILADEATRDALRASSENGRRVAREVSDVLLTLTVSHPFVVDALIVAGWHRDSPEIAGQMALINTETYAVVIALQRLVTLVASRERPFGRECGGDVHPDGRDCTSSDRRRSFFSGHASLSFTAAALTCSHHLNLELYGDPTADALACATGFVLAGTTGVLRVVGDQHYLSDVIVGATVGTLVGLGLPWLLHYRFGPDTPASTDEQPAGVDVQVVPMGLGAAAVGTF